MRITCLHTIDIQFATIQGPFDDPAAKLPVTHVVREQLLARYS